LGWAKRFDGLGLDGFAWVGFGLLGKFLNFNLGKGGFLGLGLLRSLRIFGVFIDYFDD
jgi:hypothetical protein